MSPSRLSPLVLLLLGAAPPPPVAGPPGQPAIATPYVPREAFAPFDMREAPGPVRAATGLPGPGWWQNRADYTLDVALDPKTRTIAGTAEIRYTNNSPDTLDALWLQLDQNRYKQGSRGEIAQGQAPAGYTGGMSLDAVTVDGRPVVPLVTDTRAKLALDTPLASKGVAVVRIRYHYTVPPDDVGGRTGWIAAKAGNIFSIAQWYPRMAVHDDLRGWDTLPYLAQEFYLEYGDFDYSVTVPAGMTVAGSGELVNSDAVLSADERARLDRARGSDATVLIHEPGKAAVLGTKTWRFHMDHTRDVAWAASTAFLWDAARLNLPNGKGGLAMSFYPAESAGRERWGRSTEYLKNAVENFSRRWFVFPWPNAVNVAGAGAGMEYPALAFDGVPDEGKELFWVTAHEIGHSWFPMTVGFDERRDAWMDEGFNTFIDTYESDDFNHGEYGPKRDVEFAPGGGNPVDEILPILAAPDAPPLLSRADTIVEKWRHPVTYFKSALGLKLLREEILEPDRFDPAFRRFIAAWAFKHPKPADFFRAMDDGAGEDLSWWWRGWYAHNWQLDLAVTRIAPFPAKAGPGSLVRVETHDRLVMPVTLRLTFADGTRRDMRLPAETWIRQAATDVPVPGPSRVVKAELDPDHRIPDRDRSNNVVTG